MRREYSAAEAEYEAAAAVTAEKVAKIAALDDEVDAVNYAILEARKADPDGEHPELLKSSTERYRSEPDVVVPDRQVSTQEWFVGNRKCCVLTERQGRMVPDELGAELRTVKHTIPGSVRKGRSLGAPQAYLVLPATRLDGKPYWPRSS